MGCSQAVKAITLDILNIFTPSEHVIQILRFTPFQPNPTKKIPIRKAKNGSIHKVILIRQTGLQIIIISLRFPIDQAHSPRTSLKCSICSSNRQCVRRVVTYSIQAYDLRLLVISAGLVSECFLCTWELYWKDDRLIQSSDRGDTAALCRRQEPALEQTYCPQLLACSTLARIGKSDTGQIKHTQKKYFRHV